MEVSTKPGIYCFTNTINNKCYVGQAINLKHRYKQHLHNFKNNRYNNPLYNAFKKYGLEVFTFNILEIIEESSDSLQLKDKLNDLEIFYISQKDSYYNGYNQTLGGDGGITGYKFTPEQLKTQSEKSIIRESDGRHTIFIYDKEKDIYTSFVNTSIAAKEINGTSGGIRMAKKNHTWYLKRYFIGDSVESIKQFLKEETNIDYLLEYYSYLQQFTEISVKQVSIDLGISEAAVKKRNQKLKSLGYQLPFKTTAKIAYVEVTNIIDNTTNNYTVSELSNLLGINESSVRKQIKRPTVYKNTYKFKTVYL